MDDNIKKSYDRITEQYHNALRALAESLCTAESEKSDETMNHNETLLLMMQKYLDEGWGSTMEQLMIKPLIVAIRDKIVLEEEVKKLRTEIDEADAMNDKFRDLLLNRLDVSFDKEETNNIFSIDTVNKVLKDDANNWFDEMNEVDERIKELKRVGETEPCCTSCGVPYVKHMGIIGLCAEKQHLLKLLKSTVKERQQNAMEELSKLDEDLGL